MQSKLFCAIQKKTKEKVYDLLAANPHSDTANISIWTYGNTVKMSGVTEIPCADLRTVLQAIVRAQRNRQTKKTKFIGHQSSRSHVVVTLRLQQDVLELVRLVSYNRVFFFF